MIFGLWLGCLWNMYVGCLSLVVLFFWFVQTATWSILISFRQ